MTLISTWTRFVEKQARRRPLRFVAGMQLAASPDCHCRSHFHREIEAVFHPRGRGVSHLARRRKMEFDEGSVVIYGPREMHDQTMLSEGEDLCLQWAVPVSLAPKGVLYLPRLEEPHLVAEFRTLARGYAGVGGLQQSLLDVRATSVLLQLLHLALASARAGESPPDAESVRKAEQFIRAEFQSIRSLREVAAHVGLSPNHLRHLFRRNRRVSMISYLTAVRMERAGSLLTQSRLPLKQVARLCGFADEYYFSAVFRRHHGMAPGRYRRQGWLAIQHF